MAEAKPWSSLVEVDEKLYIIAMHQNSWYVKTKQLTTACVNTKYRCDFMKLFWRMLKDLT